MIKIIVIAVVSFNFVLAIGLKALVIPQNALVLSSSNTGIGDNLSPDINPASLVDTNPFLGFSRNIWFGDLEGQKISMIWKGKVKSQFSFESLNIQDLELRNEVASDSPLGFFGAYWYAVDFSSSIGVNNFSALKSLQIGYKIKLNLSKLYTESMYGVTLDVGLRGKINENINFGVVIKNVGKEFDKNLTSNTPKTVGVGFVYQIPNAYLKLLSDIVRQDEIILTKFSIQTNFKYVNLIAGTTRADNYEDVAFGLHIHIQDWSFIYGNLNHSNTILGDPVSIELRKYF